MAARARGQIEGDQGGLKLKMNDNWCSERELSEGDEEEKIAHKAGIDV